MGFSDVVHSLVEQPFFPLPPPSRRAISPSSHSWALILWAVRYLFIGTAAGVLSASDKMVEFFLLSRLSAKNAGGVGQMLLQNNQNPTEDAFTEGFELELVGST